MKHYYSEFPNQLHQLNVSLSKNIYLLTDGSFKTQEKKFDINFKNHHKTGKRHLVNYVIRDHFSGCYYAEIHPADDLPHIVSFLYNAWRSKESFPFKGIPKYLSITKTILDQWPHILNFEGKYKKCTLQRATSGFANGVISVKKWEKDFKFFLYKLSDGWYDNIKHEKIEIKEFSRKTFDVACNDSNKGWEWDNEPSPLDKWMNNNPYIETLENPDEFLELFQPPNTKS